jgi:hypothetical protein
LVFSQQEGRTMIRVVIYALCIIIVA